MAGRTLDLSDVILTEPLANQIGQQYTIWEQDRSKQQAGWRELRNYIFATDTTTTTNATLPWKNSTTLPKLCQIRDNLHANYMAALFPNDNWMKWLGSDKDAETQEKKSTIESYMENKTRMGGFITIMSQLVLDYIDYGNVFATTEYVDESIKDEATGEVIPGFLGPRPVRISPNDIVFNPLASSFEKAPKIIRTVKSVGELKADIQDHLDQGYLEEALTLALENRTKITSLTSGDSVKAEAFMIDGFGTALEYYSSDFIEILEFHGDLYDRETGDFFKNHIITVVDRTHVIRKVPNPSWKVGSGIRHTGWRQRPDNLYSMGPLENLVGIQYRIDHLENLKADVFDMVAYPVLKIRGEVEDFDYGPNERIYTSDEGDVTFMHPDVTALNADIQIQVLENRMEEYAGAPKQAMGIRTPGEKTAFEVQTLENAAGRIFQNKTSYFEETFVEKILNDMLEVSRRQMNQADLIRVMDDEMDVALFEKITKEDLTANGKLRPMGARHFAKQAQMFQNLNGFANSAMGQDPAINAHISGIGIAKAVEELLGFEKFGLVEKNIRVTEQAETQRSINSNQEQLLQEKATMEGLNDGTL